MKKIIKSLLFLPLITALTGCDFLLKEVTYAEFVNKANEAENHSFNVAFITVKYSEKTSTSTKSYSFKYDFKKGTLFEFVYDKTRGEDSFTAEETAASAKCLLSVAFSINIKPSGLTDYEGNKYYVSMSPVKDLGAYMKFKGNLSENASAPVSIEYNKYVLINHINFEEKDETLTQKIEYTVKYEQ